MQPSEFRRLSCSARESVTVALVKSMRMRWLAAMSQTLRPVVGRKRQRIVK